MVGSENPRYATLSNSPIASATGITSAYFAFMSQRLTACEVGARS